MNDNNTQRKDTRYRVQQYAIQVIKLIDALPKDAATQILAKQLLRAATSIGANIIEAQASSSKKDFINFFHHALKSANESLFWFKIIEEARNIENPLMRSLMQETKEIGNILGASLLTLKKRKI